MHSSSVINKSSSYLHSFRAHTFGLNSLLDLPKVSELRPQTEGGPKEDEPAEEILATEDDNPSDTSEENPPEETS